MFSFSPALTFAENLPSELDFNEKAQLSTQIHLNKSLIDKDLEDLNRLQFSKVSKNFVRFFGGPSANHVTKFILDRIKKVSFYNSTNPAEHASMGKMNTIRVTKHFMRNPSIIRMAILIHEARHAEGPRFDHVTCPTPFSFSLIGMSYPISSLAHLRVERLR